MTISKTAGVASAVVALFAMTAFTTTAFAGQWYNSNQDKIEIEIKVHSWARAKIDNDLQYSYGNPVYQNGAAVVTTDYSSTAGGGVGGDGIEAKGDTSFNTGAGYHTSSSTGPQNQSQANAVGNAAPSGQASAVAGTMTSASASGGFHASGSTGRGGNNW
jgi:hypothetical protein